MGNPSRTSLTWLHTGNLQELWADIHSQITAQDFQPSPWEGDSGEMQAELRTTAPSSGRWFLNTGAWLATPDHLRPSKEPQVEVRWGLKPGLLGKRLLSSSVKKEAPELDVQTG